MKRCLFLPQPNTRTPHVGLCSQASSDQPRTVLSPLWAMRTGQPAGPARRCQPSEAPPSPVAGFLFPVAVGAVSILAPRPVPQTNAAAWLETAQFLLPSDYPSPLSHRLSSMRVSRPAQFCFL